MLVCTSHAEEPSLSLFLLRALPFPSPRGSSCPESGPANPEQTQRYPSHSCPMPLYRFPPFPAGCETAEQGRSSLLGVVPFPRADSCPTESLTLSSQL